jgi:CubicO group peptidase (beta-lactamase class C family)
VATDSVTDGLTAALAEHVERHRVPGAAAGLLVGGEAHTASVGVTNVEHPLPVTDTTLFQVASITKTFVSTAVMLLVEEGRLALDDPVGKHLPTLHARTGLDAGAITVEHLLSHQAGFDGDHLFVGRVPDSLDQLADARRLFEPGTGVSYNNAAFSIAGEVIAAVSGTSFESFVQERLLEPLGIKGYFTADEAITHRVAAPHYVVGDATGVLRGTGWQPGWELAPVDRAAGGLITSVSGLLAWARFHLDGTTADGSTLLARELVEHMHRPLVELDRWTGIGLDWFVIASEGGTAIDHGGLTVGYCSTLVLAPEKDVAVVCLTHATTGGAVNQAIRRWALEEHAGIVERDPEPDPSVTIDAARFEGRYLYPFAQLTITAGDRPNTLTVTSSRRDDVEGWKPPPDPPLTLAFVDERHAVTLDAPGPQRWTQFGFADDGTATWLTWGSRRAVRN